MTTELLILRHAKATWHTSMGVDFNRPLSERGQEAARKMGRHIERSGWWPDMILCSNAVRTVETVAGLGEAADRPLDNLHLDENIYNADLEYLLRLPGECAEPQTRRLMIVGHNPGLEDLLGYLIGDIAIDEIRRESKALPTATLARIALARYAPLEPACGELLDRVLVRELE